MKREYINNNRKIVIDLNTGTKLRLKPVGSNDIYSPIYPENIDVNLSYACTEGCPFCYINATKNGKTVTKENIQKFLYMMKDAPNGIEIAVNSNEGLKAKKALKDFTNAVKDRFIINATTRYSWESIRYLSDLQKSNKIYGVGISLKVGYENIEIINLKQDFPDLKHINFHVINGVNRITDIVENNKNISLLVLGYKNVGRGKGKQPELIQDWDYLFKIAKKNNITLIFDNLCISQILDTGYKFSEKIWEDRFLGDDGTTSLYIDLVNMRASKNSISYNQNNFEIKDENITDVFRRTREL